MIKTLIPIGDGLGIALDDAILEQLGIGQGTRLEVSVDGRALVIRPVSGDEAPESVRQARILQAAEGVMDLHAETLRKLAL